MAKLFLRRAHPNFFVAYQGVIVAALGVGAASTLAETGADTPPILATFYEWIPIHVWGWIYITVGLVLVVGLFEGRAARVGLGLMLLLLGIRLGFQVQQGVRILQDVGVTNWRQWVPVVGGLPILYGYTCSVLSMAREPFVNPATSRDITVVSMENGDAGD